MIMKTPWLPFIIIVLCLGLADCGRKGPPVPPDDEPEQQSPYPENRPDRGNRR